jgi:hypothetical protein
MAGTVLPSIETGGDPASANGSVLSDDTYVEEGTPEPNDPEERLAWGRRRYGEDWYLEVVAGREAARNARREEEERERIEDEKVEAIRRLRETKPLEYERRMNEYNLQLQGHTKAQIDNSNKPLPTEVIESNWNAISVLLQGRTLQPTTTDSANTRTTRRRSKRAAPTLAGALVDEESASNATNVKVPESKHGKTRQRKAYKGERASRRLANKPVEYGIFANRRMAPVPKDLQRNPSTRKRNPAGPRNKRKSTAVEPAKHRGALKPGREITYRSRSKKESGG